MSPELALLLAFGLDLWVGDPPGWPHPVRLMGWAIERLEAPFRRLPVPLRASGALFTLSLVAGTGLAGWLLVAVAAAAAPGLGWALEVALLATCLSVSSLAEAARAVEQALRGPGLEAARRAVALIVGRETAALDPAGVSRAAVESVAENLVDGVVAPLFFAALGGAPAALAYKMVNTLDSMVGYRNARYGEFGWASARLDDAANLLPARLAVPCISAAAGLLAGRGGPAWRMARRDARRHLSPNSGFPEAAVAGALGLRLGGPNIYHGDLVPKPWIGDGRGEAGPRDIRRACDLMVLAALVALAGSVGLTALI
jgi:adenosylcobinamide-phosphate synthase